MNIISIDPGVTTGVARHEYQEGDKQNAQRDLNWWTREFGPDDHHRVLYDYLVNEQPNIIVCEDFVYEIRRIGKGDEKIDMPGIILKSVEYIGIVKLYCYRTQTVLKMQDRAKKNFWQGPKGKLFHMGLYTAPGGRQHQNDASAHLLSYLVNDLKMTGYLSPLRPR